MNTTNETEKVNFRVAQLNFMIDQKLISKKYNVDWAFDQIDNINCKVIDTDYIRLYYKEWDACIGTTMAGSTVLHFAAMHRDFDALHTLLDHGVDITVKNKQNSTALHLIVENLENDRRIYYPIIGAYTLDDPLVHLVLSAHLKSSKFENPLNIGGLSHFHIACAVNNVELVKNFLQNGVSIDHIVKKDYLLFSGFTPLHFAAKYCAYEATEVLLSHGADIHVKDTKGMTPLLLALGNKIKIIGEENLDEKVRDKNEKILELLLEKESSYDMMIKQDWGLTQLHVACTLKDSKISERLLQKVANINHALNMDSKLWPGYSALHFAALCNVDTVKLLIKKGADIGMKDAQGTTPLDMCAEKYGADDTCGILSLSSVHKNIVPFDGKNKLIDSVFATRDSNKISSFLQKLSKNFCMGDSPLWLGCSQMHLAVLFSEKMSKSRNRDHEELNLQVFKKLWKNPKMLHIQDAHGRSPLHLACRLDKESALDLLLERIESLPKLVDVIDEDGLSYLHIASAKNRTNLIAKLLATKINVNFAYQGKPLVSLEVCSGSTALHFAVASKSTEAAEKLIKLGANVCAKDANDMTPIHLLHLDYQYKSLANVLLKTPNLRDSVIRGIGLSHLHIASFCGNIQAVKILLDKGADINRLISYPANANEVPSQLSGLERYANYSPLLLAKYKSRTEVVRLLLQRGADVFVKDREGMPLIYYTLMWTKCSDPFDRCSVEIMDFVMQNNELQTRLEAEIGMTKLHVACFAAKANLVEELIGKGANVNAQIRADSPILKGYTPMHVVMHVTQECDVKYQMIELLVEAGADVTLQDKEYANTAIHMAGEKFFMDGLNDEDSPDYYLLLTLIKAQRDFSVNPVAFDGVSHFHIACSVCDFDIVAKFLRQTDVDVNEPIDYFHSHVPGYTALHLAVADRVDRKAVSEKLATVDLLLEHGADVRAKNAFGDTPLHDAVFLKSLDVFERLLRSGADVEASNYRGNTVLHQLMEFSINVSAEKVKVLLRFGCHFNTFNALTEKGCVGETVKRLLHTEMLNLLSVVAVNFKQKMEVDDSGRTPIHNLVSSIAFSLSAHEYVEQIDQLSRMGYDVDDQDNLGRTALHMAVKFNNFHAISGLLMAGADVNITDGRGKTVFDYIIDICELIKETSIGPVDAEFMYHQTLETLKIHVKNLQLCGLDVNEKIVKLACKAYERLGNTGIGYYNIELYLIKNTKIRSYSTTFNDFLSENEAVADYPTMPEMKRNDIDEFFTTGEIKSLRVKFPESASILQLQYRKARARPQLLKLATDAMELLIGFSMPEICSYLILVPLKNSELKSLIASVTV